MQSDCLFVSNRYLSEPVRLSDQCNQTVSLCQTDILQSQSDYLTNAIRLSLCVKQISIRASQISDQCNQTVSLCQTDILQSQSDYLTNAIRLSLCVKQISCRASQTIWPMQSDCLFVSNRYLSEPVRLSGQCNQTVSLCQTDILQSQSDYLANAIRLSLCVKQISCSHPICSFCLN